MNAAYVRHSLTYNDNNAPVGGWADRGVVVCSAPGGFRAGVTHFLETAGARPA